MSSGRNFESVERFVAAPAAAVFDLLADPSRHHEIDGSGWVVGAKEPSQRLRLGSEFGMSMRSFWRYSMVSTVIELETDRRIAWQTWPDVRLLRLVIGGRIWRYELVPQDGGVLVRETWDISQERIKPAIRVLRSKVRRSMATTLDNIARAVTTAPPGP